MGLTDLLTFFRKPQQAEPTRVEEPLPPLALILDEQRKSQNQLSVFYEDEGKHILLKGYVTHKPYPNGFNFGSEIKGDTYRFLYFEDSQRNCRVIRVLDSEGRTLWDYVKEFKEKQEQTKAQAS